MEIRELSLTKIPLLEWPWEPFCSLTCQNVLWDVFSNMYDLVIHVRDKPHGISMICKTLFYDTMFCQNYLFLTWDQGKLLVNLVKLGPLSQFTHSRKKFCSNKPSWQAKDKYRDICCQSNCLFLRDHTQFVFTRQPYLLINVESISLGVHSLGYLHTFSVMLACKDF